MKISFSKMIFALLLIGIGVAFLLSNFGVIDMDMGDLFRTYWPLFIIWVGASTIFSAFRYRKGQWRTSGGTLFVGVLILLLGWNFLADNLGWYTLSFSFIWSVFWPLFLIYIGIKILFRKKGAFIRFDMDFDTHSKKKERNEDVIDIEADRFFEKDASDTEGSSKGKRIYKSSLIGDIDMGRDTFHLEDLHLWNGIGDVDLDLTRAIIPDGETKILISGWIGDVDVIVPHDMPVWIEAHIRIGDIQLIRDLEGGINRDKEYKSIGYDEALKKVHMIIELKIGDIRVLQR